MSLEHDVDNVVPIRQNGIWPVNLRYGKEIEKHPERFLARIVFEPGYLLRMMLTKNETGHLSPYQKMFLPHAVIAESLRCAGYGHLLYTLAKHFFE